MAIPGGASQQPQPNQPAGQPALSPGTVISRVLGEGLPIAAIGSGLAYILGRTYLAAYYRELNIPLSVLELDTVDHLFASTETIVASLISAIIIGSAYHFRDTLFQGEGGAGVALVLTLALAIGSIAVVYSDILGGLPGITGVVIGSYIGLVFAVFPVLLTRDRSFARFRRMTPIVFVLLGIVLFVYLSTMARTLGSTQASKAGRELPVAIVRLVGGKEIPELFRGLKSDEAVPLKIAAMSKEFVYGLDLRDCENQPKVRFKLLISGGQFNAWVQSNLFGLAVQADCSRIVAIPSGSIAAICHGKDEKSCSHLESTPARQSSR